MSLEPRADGMEKPGAPPDARSEIRDRREKRAGLGWLFLSVVCLGIAAWSGSRLASGSPALGTIRIEQASALEDLAFLGLGMRRQAADIHFIRLLQYYGGPEHSEGHDEEGEGAGEEHGHHHHHGRDYGGGAYTEMFGRAQRMLELDPYFRYGCLYAAGALAFNLNRPDEAIALLRSALIRDPKAWRYHLFIAAIAYRKEREFGRLVEVLEPALRDADCPAMLKTIVAGIYQRLGRVEKALALYQDILQNSRDPEYRELARGRIGRIGRRSGR